MHRETDHSQWRKQMNGTWKMEGEEVKEGEVNGHSDILMRSSFTDTTIQEKPIAARKRN